MKAKVMLLQLLLQLTLKGHAQEILGTITDQRGEPLVNATVQVKQGGIAKGGTVSDFDGHYEIKLLEPGLYDVSASFTGYQTMMMTNVVVSPGEKTALNMRLKLSSHELKEVMIKEFRKPLVDKYKNNTVLTSEEIHADGSRSPDNPYLTEGVGTQELVRLTPGIYQQKPSAQRLNVKNFDPSTAEYKKIPENEFRTGKSSPVSTMSVDVDRASYSNLRRFINGGQNPPTDAVRIEEMINYFHYDYPVATKEEPLAVQTETTACPWNTRHSLLRIGMLAKSPDLEHLPPSNLVFLIDVSGSMNEPDRLPLVKASLRLLVKSLRDNDHVAIVTYAGNAGLVLPSTPGSMKRKMLDAIDRLEAGGSTAGGEGIELAYKVAKTNFIAGGNNRVVLATDGDFNVGVSSDGELEDLIVKERQTGVFLTCLGVGDDNYKDAKMEVLADKGNGNYDYLDGIKEAEKTLVKEFWGTMFTVAKDVKAQIEFNPLKVASYRLIGYEKRVLNTEDFKDDNKDAGDMGAGHMVTILYELTPPDTDTSEARPIDELRYQTNRLAGNAYSDETALIRFRYKEVGDTMSKELTHVVDGPTVAFKDASENTRFAAGVALFGMILKKSAYDGTCTYEDVMTIASGSLGKDIDGYRTEFLGLVAHARANSAQTSAK